MSPGFDVGRGRQPGGVVAIAVVGIVMMMLLLLRCGAGGRGALEGELDVGRHAARRRAGGR